MNVLLVEDDVGIGRFVSQGLELRGLRVRWERSGRGIADVVAAGGYNTMVLDLGLPDGDGLEICAAIRAAGFGIPILMLTARAALPDRLDGFAAGTDDYLVKPFAMEELVARVDVLLARDRERRPDPVRYDKLRIDPASRLVQWDGRPIETDPRCFALLLQLARAGGKVVARTDLIEGVWGADAVITDNAVDVCVSAVRRRLAAVTRDMTVHAARGRGLSLRVTGMSKPSPT